MGTINDAWQQGYQAYRDGDDESDNPYPKNTDEHEQWLEGHRSACDDDV